MPHSGAKLGVLWRRALHQVLFTPGPATCPGRCSYFYIMNTQFESVYETDINAPAAKVWQALTDPEIVRQYFFGSNLKSTWKIGEPISFSGEYEGQSYEDKGIIREFIPEELLTFTYLSNWSGLEDKPENYLLVSYFAADRTGRNAVENYPVKL
jgi:hypothetical protein